MGIATLVLTIIGEVGKIAADAVSASQEELAALEARCKAALDALRDVRRDAERSIDARHAEAHTKFPPAPTDARVVRPTPLEHAVEKLTDPDGSSER